MCNIINCLNIKETLTKLVQFAAPLRRVSLVLLTSNLLETTCCFVGWQQLQSVIVR